ncbi:MAG: hypothetical protein E7069_10980 [Bacteroidales bacterium]|jgi:hypothetical protein|nr:hypothetical protein [Bacteroidales bacterium]
MKNLFTTIFATAALLVANNAWADEDVTTIYERGSSTAWSETDLENWAQSYCTATIDGGLSVSTTNGGWTCSKSITVTENSIITLNATIMTGGASGRSGSYDYIKIGGIIVGFNEQDKKAFVDVDGSSSDISLTYARNTDYDIQIVINQASGSISYKVGTAEGTTVSNTTISNIEFGHYKAARENYAINPKLKTISVVEEAQSATTAYYTVKYVYGENEIKTSASRSGVVGDVISLLTSDKEPLFNSDNSKKYIYESDDSENKAIESDGSSVVTVNFREAETYNYAVKTSFDEVISSGSTFEGETVIVPFSKFLVNEGTLYTAAAINKEYRTSFVPTENDFTQVVTYSEVDLGSSTIAYISEAENIEGATISTAANANIRCSNAAGAAFSSDTKITTLEAGKYIIGAAVWGAAGTTYTISAGEENNFEMTTAGYIVESESDTIYITEQTDVVIAAQAETSKALDYVYVRKVGDITTTYTIKYVNELGSELDCIDNIVTEINIGEEFTATEAQMAEIVDSESELTYVYKSGNETKTAVAEAAENVITLVYELKVEPQDPGTVTSVGSVKANAADGDIYTLGGVKVVNPTPGLYIQNGKLVRVK